MSSKYRNLGFSLVELMVAVTIIGILSVIAIPSYKDYILKAKFSNLLAVADYYKMKLTNDFITDGRVLADEIDHSKEKLPEYIKKIVVKDLQDQATLELISDPVKLGLPNRTIDHDIILQFIANNSNDWIDWTCKVDAKIKKYIPQNCEAM